MDSTDKSPQELLDEARAQVTFVSVDEAMRLHATNRATFLDIREPEEVALGYIKGTVFIRADELEMQAHHLLPDKRAPVILYCEASIRSTFTALTFKEMGYTGIRVLEGGFKAWEAAGNDLVTDGVLSRDQINHYSRQIILKEVGLEGQTRLLNARVLLVGAGGLGSPAAMYLAAAGVGTIGIVDFDRVEKSNLNRQVIHAYGNIGKPKVESACEAIARLNPDVKLEPFNQRLTPVNALDIVNRFDVVLDATDNFTTKYLLNDACFFAGKPYVFGGAIRFEGQAAVFHPTTGGPCLRCVMPRPPRDELSPT